MDKIKVLLVDADEKYLAPLEKKFIDGFEDRGDISVISDISYLNSFFKTPQKIDVLMINEELYDPSIEKHDIGDIFILTEQIYDSNSTVRFDTKLIYKYTSVKEILNEVINNLSLHSKSAIGEDKETRVIMVHSPIGGIGKTTISMGLSAVLAKNYKKTLYISTDNLQSFGFLLHKSIVAKGEIEKQMTRNSEDIFEYIRPIIVKEQFDYIPPFTRALSSLNIKIPNYIHLINCIKVTKEYDYIIVDTASDFTEEISKLMGFANNTIIVAGQDRVSAHKLDCLLNNIDCSDSNKFLFICNRYQSDCENVLIEENFIKKCRISEYIDTIDESEVATIEGISSKKGLQKLAFMIV